MTSTLTFPIRANVGSATVGLLNTTISKTATTGTGFSVNSGTLTNFLDVAYGAAPASGVNIVLAFDYGTTNAEKMLCTYSSGTFTIQQRYYDQQTPPSGGLAHIGDPTGVNAATVIPVFSATEAAEHNAAVQSLVHVITGGSLGTISSPGAISISSGSGSAGTATTAAHSDHTHVLSTSSFNAALAGSTIPGSTVSGALAGSVTLDASQLTAVAANTALPANTTIAATQVTGSFTSAQLSNAANTWYPTPVTSGTLTNSSVSYISQTGVTGFTTYLITFNASVAMGSTAKGVVASIGINGTSTSTAMTQTIQASSSSILTSTFIYTTTASATPTINGMLYVGSGGSATLNAATLSIVGLA